MMKTKTKKRLVAFHGKQAVKDKYLRRVEAHRKADELVQSYGYWNGGKGCAVGCTLEKDADNETPHKYYEPALGIPCELAHLEDCIFENLPAKDAQQWPGKFLAAIQPGADLSRVKHEFCYWLLAKSKLMAIADGNRQAIAAVAELHRRAAQGDAPSEKEWSEARSAPWPLAWSLAWLSAESSAWSSAESAAESARLASLSAAESARSAQAAAVKKIARNLLRLLAAAPLMDRTAKAMQAAKADADRRGLRRGNGGAGAVQCLACESGELNYSVSGFNGHMHAACSTEGCVRWME